MCLNTYFLESESARGVAVGLDKGGADGEGEGIGVAVEVLANPIGNAIGEGAGLGLGVAVEVLDNPIGNADDERIGAIGVSAGLEIGLAAGLELSPALLSPKQLNGSGSSAVAISPLKILVSTFLDISLLNKLLGMLLISSSDGLNGM